MFRLAPVLLLVLASQDAAGYVRTITKSSGAPVLWTSHCIDLIPDARGSRHISSEVFEDALARSVANWTSRIDACSFMRLSVKPASGPREVDNDGLPIVLIRDDEWSRPGKEPHDRSAIGLTTVFFITSPGQPGDGFILDADVELNNVNFTLTTTPLTTPAREGTQLADLENTLTHELGHVLGLGHTCYIDDGTTPRPLSSDGKPTPECFQIEPLSKVVMDATMYPFSESSGEITKRSLSDDDVAGVCDSYPTDSQAGSCYRFVVGGNPTGCSLSPSARAPDLAEADRSLSSGDLPSARSRYREALSAGGHTARLAARGLGDIALREREPAGAVAYYRQALDGASGVLALELREKLALAERRLLHQRLAWAAWLIYALSLAWFARCTARARVARWPSELLYVAPVYLLMCACAIGRDSDISLTLWLGAAGSALVIALSGWARPGRPLRHAATLVVANLALFYGVLQAGGLLDRIG